MSIMETADLLLELMFKWISESEACAWELEKMAAEIEKVHRTLTVIRGSSLLGAAVRALAGAQLIEHVSSSNIMKKVQKKEEESKSIAEEIKRKFEQLKKKLKEQSPQMDPDDLDQQVMTAFMGAVGRRSGNIRVISLLEDMSFDFGGGRNMMFQDRGSVSWFSVEMLGVTGVLTFFAFQPNGKRYNFLFSKAEDQLVKKMSSTTLRTALKRGTWAVGGAVGLVIALDEAIDNWKKLIKNNHVTEVSKSQRDMANSILEMTRNLKEQLDNIRKGLQKLADVKRCIENTDRSLEDRKKLIEYAIENSNDDQTKPLLADTSTQKVFFGLLNMFTYLKDKLDKELRWKKIYINDIDITFVAHGAIQENMISANCLVHLPSIKDVVLYSPWNCYLTAEAAYGIATGGIQPELRRFFPPFHRPNHLPPYWNLMRRSGGDMIPVITVSSITPDNGEWKRFEHLETELGEPGRNRVVLPFLFPEKVKVPFHIVTLALSLVLRFSYFRATVHLAACLGKASPETHLDEEHLMEQYAYTEDKTAMTTPRVMQEPRFNELYRFLNAVFNMTPAPRSWF